ncbi:MAG: RelA/SpoT domain-containing protein [Eubacterium sp.]|nr:RelA/SpoT domain-containing protein [Eubacterium sp.]
MAFNNTKELDLEEIQRRFNINQKRLRNLPISDSELKEIYQDFQTVIPKLEEVRLEILSILNKRLSGKVHSIRCRIKDKDHLIEKIVRNICDKPDKYKNLNVENYNKIITDLIGVRIILLDKRDWREVHNSLLEIFRNMPERYAVQPNDIVINYDLYKEESEKEDKELENSYHAEQPIVYITSKDDRELYFDNNLRIDHSKTHYRSLHYIIRYKFVYFEIQMRTLFEEGWLEFDHRIKYPYDQNNVKKNEFVSVLNSLAVAADRLISFYDEKDFQRRFENGINEESDNQEIEDNVCEFDNQTFEGKLKQLF